VSGGLFNFFNEDLNMDYTRVFNAIDESSRRYLVERAAAVGVTPGQYISTVLRKIDFDERSGPSPTG
jgi:hypothetical protein